MAQSVEVRRQCRAGAFHHSAPAGKAGRDADQGFVADRLSTAELFGAKIKDFDLIVFDRYSNAGLLPPAYFDNIVRYVREGGAMLIVAGPEFAKPESIYYTPIGKVIPAFPKGDALERPFRPKVTKDGARHPVTRDLPGANAEPPDWSEWFRLIDAELLRGDNILSGPDRTPVAELSHGQKGRVGLLLTDQSWLWARSYRNGGPYLELMRRLAHWLLKEPELEEESLRASVRGHDVKIERQSLLESVPAARLTSPSGETSEIVMDNERRAFSARILPPDAKAFTASSRAN